MADRKSESTEEEVKTAAKPLEEQDIKVIPVVIGGEADPRELGNTTPDKKNLIEADKGDDPRIVGEKIMEKIRGNCQTHNHTSILQNCIYNVLGPVRVVVHDGKAIHRFAAQ